MSVIILGAGVAGHSAACWLHDWGEAYTWLDDQPEAGGVLRRLHNPLHNTPGQRHADGPSLVRALGAERAALEIPAPRRFEASQVTRSGDELVITDAQGSAVSGRALILATGTCYRRLEVPGEEAGLEAGLVRQSASGYAKQVAGREVAMIGGGDAAYEGALILAAHGCAVHLIQRGAARARAQFVEQVAATPAIRILSGAQVAAMEPGDGELGLTLDDGARLTVACAFVRVGVSPRLPKLWAPLELDAAGYVVVDRAQRTSLAGVFAAGDVTDCPLRSVVTAAGSGALAAWGARAG